VVHRSTIKGMIDFIDIKLNKDSRGNSKSDHSSSTVDANEIDKLVDTNIDAIEYMKIVV
jgi:hypothetical protein